VLVQVAAAAAGALGGLLLPGIDLVAGALLGLAVGVLVATLHALFDQLPSLRRRWPALAAVTLPVTAVASVYGMNVIVNQRTHVPQLLLVLSLMVAMSAALLRWTKRQGWW
jgi:hypothetical protein